MNDGYRGDDVLEAFTYESPEDTELELALFEQNLKDIYDWIERIEDASAVDRKYVNVTWMYGHYRSLERIVRNITDVLTNEQWNEVEQLRKTCEKYRQMYAPKLIPVDLEP